MATKNIHVLPFRRKRQGKTNYRKRLKILLAEKPRVVIRKFLKNIQVQIIDYGRQGDKVLVSAHSRELGKLGWKFNKANLPSAYLVGLLAGRKAVKKGVKEAILDIGLVPPVKGSKIYACLKGCIDAGLNIPHSEEVLVKEERITGKHIAGFAEKSKEAKVSNYQFAGYEKSKADPKQISNEFNIIKEKIMKG